MTLLPRAPAFLLAFDPVTINRPSANAALTGVSYSTVYSGRGTFGLPTARDFIYSEDTDRANVIDATLTLPLAASVQHDDQVVGPRGTFIVVATEVRRLQQRVLLRKVG